MSQRTQNYVVCDACGGAIPTEADQINGVTGILVVEGSQTAFANLDFCCTAHLENWLGAIPQVATPDPAYSPPVVAT